MVEEVALRTDADPESMEVGQSHRQGGRGLVPVIYHNVENLEVWRLVQDFHAVSERSIHREMCQLDPRQRDALQ